jgi:hypothetical protein
MVNHRTISWNQLLSELSELVQILTPIRDKLTFPTTSHT